MPKNRVIGIALVIILIVIGFLRDSMFIWINALRKAYLDLINAFPNIPGNAFYQNSVNYLYNTKWILTGLYTLLYSYIALLIIFLIFKNISFVKISFALMIGIGSVAIMIYVGGIMLNHSEIAYTLARRLMGLLQSPVLLMILLAACFFYSRLSLNRD